MTKIVLRVVFYSLLLYAGFFLYFSSSKSYLIANAQANRSFKIQTTYLPIVRLHDPMLGFICSAVVISDTTALTAAHCIFDEWTLSPVTVQYIVWDLLYTKEIKNVIPVSFDRLRDVAVLNGNFREFSKIKPDFSGMLQQDLKNTQIKICGFPGGGELFCNSITYVSNWFFQMKFTGGQLYRGMSGGPVMVQDNNGEWWLIGVASAVFFNSIIVAPIVGIKGHLL